MQTRIVDKITSILFSTDESKKELIAAVKQMETPGSKSNTDSNFEDALHFLLFNAKEKELQLFLAPRLRTVMINYLRYDDSNATHRQEKAGLPYNFYISFIERGIDGGLADAGDAYKKYIAAHTRNYTWGTDAEALALAELFDLSLVCYSVKSEKDTSNPKSDANVMRRANPAKGVVALYCINFTHWYLVSNHPHETIGDGNCLYNAWAQVLRQLAIHQDYNDKHHEKSSSSLSLNHSNTENSQLESKQADKSKIDSSQGSASGLTAWEQAYRDQANALRILGEKIPSVEEVNDSVQQAIHFLNNNPDYSEIVKKIIQETDAAKQVNTESSTSSSQSSSSNKKPEQPKPNFSSGKIILAIFAIILSIAAIASGVGALVGMTMLAIIGKLAAGVLIVGGASVSIASGIYVGSSIKENNKQQQDTKSTPTNNSHIHAACSGKNENEPQPKQDSANSKADNAPIASSSTPATSSAATQEPQQAPKVPRNNNAEEENSTPSPSLGNTGASR